MSGPYATDYTTLLTGSYWNGIQQTGKPVFITYSFDSTAPPSDLSQGHISASAFATFQPYTPAQQTQAQQALADWSAASGIVFLQVAPGKGDINFASYNFSTDTEAHDAGGMAYYPWGEWNNATYPYFAADSAGSGNVLMNTADETNGVFTIATVLHEIGHALGLKHPDEPWTLYGPPTPVAYNSWNPTVNGGQPSPSQTVMNEGATSLTALGPLDIQAIQSIYGAPSLQGTMDSSHSWNATTDTLTQHVNNSPSIEVRGISTSNVIYAGTGADTIMAIGSVVNKVYAGTGADLLVGGSGTNYLYAGSGADTLMGGPGVNVAPTVRGTSYLFAGSGHDTFYGAFDYAAPVNGSGGGHSYADFADVKGNMVIDLLNPSQNTGVAAGDTFWSIHNLIGSNGNDTLIGDNGDGTSYAPGDVINAPVGNDSIVGGTGRDTITAGSGADTISGGGGGDSLKAGSSADVFQYAALSDSTNTGTGRDTISGFSSAHDVINFVALEQAVGETFSFIGTAAFNGQAGEIREQTVGSNLYLYLDSTGHKTADFSIVLTDMSSLPATSLQF